MNRRHFLLALAGSLGVACAPAAPTGLRGTGTVLRRALTGPDSTPTPIATPTTVPTPPPSPTPDLPIVPSEARRPAAEGSTDAQAHVAPVPSGPAPQHLPLPARRLVIPAIGLDERVIPIGTRLDRHGERVWETAPFAIGHHRGTAGPGQAGNMVLSGHISSPGEGAVFHHLPKLRVGEGFIVGTDERLYLYLVTDVRTVTPQEVAVMAPTAEPTATLITCVPDGIYSHRLVVSGKLV